MRTAQDEALIERVRMQVVDVAIAGAGCGAGSGVVAAVAGALSAIVGDACRCRWWHGSAQCPSLRQPVTRRSVPLSSRPQRLLVLMAPRKWQHTNGRILSCHRRCRCIRMCANGSSRCLRPHYAGSCASRSRMYIVSFSPTRPRSKCRCWPDRARPHYNAYFGNLRYARVSVPWRTRGGGI